MADGTSVQKDAAHRHRPPAWIWLAAALTVAAGAYLSTLQTDVNGSESPYATDVGEIQNALPRWGTLHEPGYPLYSLSGALAVTALRAAGVEPAAGASLFSMLWALATVAALYGTARELGLARPWAASGATVAGLGTSQWMDASLAEVHTMGTALTALALLAALRYARSGRRTDLLLLVAAFCHGAVHQRTLLFLGPALLVVLWPRRREALRHWRSGMAVALTAPIPYLYLPARAWLGSGWQFGQVGEWRGLLAIALDTKVGKVIALPGDLPGWLERANGVARLLHDDLWLPVLLMGLGGIATLRRTSGGWRAPLALTLAWLPSVGLAMGIWEGRVSDALLAAKLPVTLMAGLGLAAIAQRTADAARGGGWLAGGLLTALVVAQLASGRPQILAVTRDPAAEAVIALAEQVADPGPGQLTTLMALWGHKFWALSYAQAYRGALRGLHLVDHNADLARIVRQEGGLLTLSETLYHLPPAWWDDLLGRACLGSPAPGIVTIRAEPLRAAEGGAGPALDLGNGVRILSAVLRPGQGDDRIVDVVWQAERDVDADYAVAVHLLARDPPSGQGDVLAQADRRHPVDGWYPTSRWEAGEVVPDAYRLTVPAGAQPAAVRLAMYRQGTAGAFETTPWLTLPWAP